MNNPKLLGSLTLAVLTVLPSTSAAAAAPAARHTFEIGTNDFLLDGRRLQVRCGEIHAPRIPREYWRNRLQMARAMGLNTVCAYLFWNLHEPRPGQFNWSGQADAAEFCRLAQQEGLWVILRPGPYSCAEWDMGGLPWWLLKNEGIKLRTRDSRFLEPAKTYLAEVGRVLGPLQVTRGGPILMAQVENEYGSFGKDEQYMGELREALRQAGFEVPLFACNPKEDLKKGYRADLFPVVNFGKDPAGAFAALRRLFPQGPLMCGEYYPGWFDTWGAPHHTGKLAGYLADLDYMLRNDASFSIYMVHGGTTFGLWSGADRPFKPDTSSYDYDAPISEAGWPTEKFFKSRELFGQFLLPGEQLTPVPATNPVGSFAACELHECAPLLANLPAAIKDERPRNMEAYDVSQGCIVYRTSLPAGPAGTLSAAAIHDFAYVFLDGKRVAIMDRRAGACPVSVPARSKRATLTFIVEAMGHINFGPENFDPKGLLAPVRFAPEQGEEHELTGWEVFPWPLDQPRFSKLHFKKAQVEGPVFWRGTFQIPAPQDTFLDLRSWGKGVLWVNGHCLGRFWNIGPTQTAYLPGPWLKPGKNEIIILDYLGPSTPVIAGLDKPILDQLRPELDFSQDKATR
jgi:beta-galactosidase